MATYLITGGAGFIGSHLAQNLLEQGHDVRIFDNFSTGRTVNLSPMQDGEDGSRIEIVEGDLRSYHSVWAAMQGVNYVLHQGALPSVPRSIADPISSNEVNVTGTLNVLHSARDAGVRRVVFASSSSVYGDNPKLPKVETMTPRPRSPYAVSKLAAEQYCGVFTQIYGLETVALRYFNVFGPRQDPQSLYSAVIPKFVTAALEGRPVTIHGDGTQSRDFTYIDNVVNANLRACLAEDGAGHAVNVSCGDRFTLLDVLDGIESILGHPIERRHTENRGGDVKHSQADISRAGELIGYEPSVPFYDGLARTVAWYQESRQWTRAREERF